MERFIKIITRFNKNTDKPITDDEMRLAVLMNKHLLIKRYEERIKRSKRV